MIKPIYNYFGGVGPNNCIFRGFPYISWDGVLFYSFDSLKFVHRYLYCTYYNIMCLHSFCSITSWASRRNTSPVILPTIIFVFLSMLLCKAYPWELHLFKSSYFYSDISCKVMCPMTSIVLSVTLFVVSRAGYPSSFHFVCDALWGEKIILHHFRLRRKEGLAAIMKT